MIGEATDRLIRQVDVTELTTLSRSALYRRMGQGEFPLPLKIGKAIRWRRTDIEDWLASLEKANLGPRA